MKYRFLILAIVSAFVGLNAATPSARADGGFIGGLIDKVYPGAGTAMDEWNREFKNRQSSESVWNHVMNAHIPNEPFRPAQPSPANGWAAPANVRLGTYCVTQAGSYFGPVNPVGMYCTANTPWGVFPGQVM